MTRVRTGRALVLLLTALALAVAACIGAAPSATTLDAPAATPLAGDGVLEVDGKRVLTVSEVLSGRDAGALRDGPIALRGFWSPRWIAHSCPAPMSNPGDLELYCSDGEFGIAEQKEPFVVRHGRGWRIAEGVHLTPFVPGKLYERLHALPTFGDLFHPPVPIVVVGHFDDPRADLCRPEARQLCRDRFVIDRIVAFDPSSVPPPTPTPQPTPFPSPAPSGMFEAASCHGDVPYSFVGWTPLGELGIDVLDDPTTHVWAAVTRDVIAIGQWIRDPNGSGHLWRTWGRGVCFSYEDEPEGRSFGIVTGTELREWDNGSRTDPSGAAPTIGPGPSATLSESEMGGEPDLPPATLALRDFSGKLLAARPADPTELAQAGATDAGIGAWNVGGPRSILFVWAECASDTEATLTITPDLLNLVLEPGSRTDCEGPGARRGTMLEFAVDVAASDLLVVAAT